MIGVDRKAVAPVPTEDDALASWVRWLLASGVQSDRGYFYDWYDRQLGGFHEPYPEITGYGVSTLVWLAARTGDAGLLERARRASRWLCSVALESRWQMVRAFKSGRDGLAADSYLYAFDSGVIAAGMVRLAASGEDELAGATARRIGATFRAHLLRGDGTLWPLVDVRSQTPVEFTEKWSYRFSGYQLKTLAFLLLDRVSNREGETTDGVANVFEHVLAKQHSDGAFAAFEGGETHLHPHFYTIEGLVIAAHALRHPEWLSAAERGFAYAERLYRANRVMPTQAHGDRITLAHERTDVLAQFLRLGSYFMGAGARQAAFSDRMLASVRAQLLRAQVSGGCQRGGFVFGRDFDGRDLDHVSSCASLFAGQALSWFEHARAGQSLDPLELV